MAERVVGIAVALREHRIAVRDRDGEAVGQSFTIAASQDGVATLVRTLAAREATARAQGKSAKQALIGVAVKLLHTLYAMLKHRRPYNPSRLLVAAATIGT